MKERQEAVEKRRRSRGREWLYRAIALLLPVLVLVLTELILRAVGYGADLRLFSEEKELPGYLTLNPEVSLKYFYRQENATIGNHELFRAKKAKGTLRLFVLGESTTIGYPYMHNGAFHRWLQYRLMHDAPDQDFEVINLSLTAVNSYTVWDFARQLADYEPDAVLIYTGHNEYVGAMGIGSTGGLLWHPLLIRQLIRWRELRLVQGIGRLAGAIRNTFSGKAPDLRENLMKRMGEGQAIPYESKSYYRGLRQFEDNLELVMKIFNERKIPVFISNLVSNEKDLAPLDSRQIEFKDKSALNTFRKAGAALQKGDTLSACRLFQQARDLDELRFRAPTDFNAIIRSVSEKFQTVYLVNADSAFRTNSRFGIIGEETLLEHVHPNLMGYAILSDVFYNRLRDTGILPVRGEGMTFRALCATMPLNLVDTLMGKYEVAILKEGWPFNEPGSNIDPDRTVLEEKLAGAITVKQIQWKDAMATLFEAYKQSGRMDKALRVSEALCLEYPLDPGLLLRSARISLDSGEDEKASRYFRRAYRIQPSLPAARGAFVSLLKLDRPDEALPFLDYSISQEPSSSALLQLREHVLTVLNSKKGLETDPMNSSLYNNIANAYFRFANRTAAKKYVEMALRRDPQNKEALVLRQKLLEDVK